MNLPDIFNLAFGDKNVGTGEINDIVVTDNGDSENEILKKSGLPTLPKKQGR